MKQSKGLALWVPAESKSRFFSSLPAQLPLKNSIAEFDFTDIFLQVFRQGKTFFDSSFFESECKSEALLSLIQFSKERNIRVNAWLNVCNLGTAPSQKFLDFLGGEDSRLMNNYESVIQNEDFQIDTPGQWVDPSNPKLSEALKILLAEVAALNFDGIHLDFIRYPYAIPIRPASWINLGVDFGYSELAIERFLAGRPKSDYFSDIPLQLVSEEKSLEFDNWRRTQITNLVKVCRSELINAELSVAALAWSDRAYLNAYQDWRAWLQDGLIDSLALMTYTADSKLLLQQCKQASAFISAGQKLFAGVGLYKLKKVRQLQEQIDLIHQNGFTPCIFCAEALLEEEWTSASMRSMATLRKN